MTSYAVCMRKNPSKSSRNSGVEDGFLMRILSPVERPLRIRVVGKWRAVELRCVFSVSEGAIATLPFRGIIDREDHFILVRWSPSILEPLASAIAKAKEEGHLPPILIVHREGETPPSWISNAPTVCIPITGIPLETLRSLAIAVFAPSAYKGMICCDYVDFAYALSSPGHATLVTACDADPVIAIQKLLESTQHQLMAFRNDSRVCVGIALPSSACDLSLLDTLSSAIEGYAEPDTFIQFSMNLAETELTTVSMLIVSTCME